jgi:hypothetical protein
LPVGREVFPAGLFNALAKLILEVHSDALALCIAIEHTFQRIFSTHSTLFEAAIRGSGKDP